MSNTTGWIIGIIIVILIALGIWWWVTAYPSAGTTPNYTGSSQTAPANTGGSQTTPTTPSSGGTSPGGTGGTTY